MSFPETFHTARIWAERLQLEHEADLFAMNQDPLHMATLGGVRDAVHTAAYLKRNLEHWARFGFGPWILRDAEKGRVIGRALLRHLDVEGKDEIEVGYSFAPDCWGRGLATEIAQACIEHGRAVLGLGSIVAITLPDNLRSRRVMEKLGMRYERDTTHDGHRHVLYRTT